jgi:hypothetical protein
MRCGVYAYFTEVVRPDIYSGPIGMSDSHTGNRAVRYARHPTLNVAGGSYCCSPNTWQICVGWMEYFSGGWMEGKVSDKDVIDIAGNYFGLCYGLLVTRFYYRERWFVFLTVLLTLVVVLCMMAFSVTASAIWRNLLGVALSFESLYAIYMVWFVRWLDSEYKKGVGVSRKTKRRILQKTVIENICQIKLITVDELNIRGREIVGGRNMLTAVLPVSNWFSTFAVAALIGYGISMITSLGDNSPAWLYAGDIISVVCLLFIQYALVLRIAVWRIRENIIHSRFVPLHVLLADIEKLYKETVV